MKYLNLILLISVLASCKKEDSVTPIFHYTYVDSTGAAYSVSDTFIKVQTRLWKDRGSINNVATEVDCTMPGISILPISDSSIYLIMISDCDDPSAHVIGLSLPSLNNTNLPVVNSQYTYAFPPYLGAYNSARSSTVTTQVTKIGNVLNGTFTIIWINGARVDGSFKDVPTDLKQ